MDIDKQTRWADDGFGDVMDEANGETIALVMGSRHLKAHKTRLIAAAPEMYELIEQVADLQNSRLAIRIAARCVAGIFDGAACMELVEEMDRVADLARDLLARIKGEVENEL